MPSKRHSWLGFTTLYVALLLIPILLYIFVYQGSRIDEATMRNFRSLEAAAERINQTMKTMRQVATNYSFGVDPELLADIAYPSRGRKGSTEQPPTDRPHNMMRAMHQIVSDHFFGTDSSLLGHVASSTSEKTDLVEGDVISAHNAALDLKKIIDKQLKHREIAFDVTSVIINPKCYEDADSEACTSIDEVKHKDNCPRSLWHCRYARRCSSGLNVSAAHLVDNDCRPLRERNKQLHGALLPQKRDSSDDGASRRALARLLDKFGIEVSMDTKDALEGPTRHLSMFFDSYFVANDEKKIVYSASARVDHDDDRPHRAGAPFVSLAKIDDILSVDYEIDQGPAAFADEQAPGRHESALVGHSVVRTVDVNGVELSVFIHPFTINQSLAGERDEISLWYVVGALPRSVLAREAIRIRLGPATDAILAIALLLAVMPILRFWSAGDRSVIGRTNIYAVGASVVGAAALGTALLSSTVQKDADGHHFDEELRRVSLTIVERFVDEITSTIAVLEEDVDIMLRELGAFQPRPQVLEGMKGAPEEEVKGPSLEESMLCKSTEDGDGIAMVQSSFLLNTAGTMVACTQYRDRQSRRLRLGFREYFEDPHTTPLKSVERFSWKRGPHILRPIDSVVQGKKEVVMSFALEEAVSEKVELLQHALGKRKEPIAAAVIGLSSVDGVVLKPPYRYAVVNQLGDTLFHSDKSRERVSNVLDDTGSDEKVHLAITSGRSRFLDTYYDGIPIRAYFSPLYESDDEEWVLIVYRHHRFVDSLSSLNISLSIIAWLALVTFSMLLISLASVSVRRVLGRGAMLPYVVAVLVDGKSAIAALILGALGWAFSYGSGRAALCVGTLLPIAVALVVYWEAWRCESSCVRGGPRHVPRGRVATKGTFMVAAVVLAFSVVPMFAWHSYFRGELVAGRELHVKDELKESFVRKKDDFREYKNSLAEQQATCESRFLNDHSAMSGKRSNGHFVTFEMGCPGAWSRYACPELDGEISELFDEDEDLGGGRGGQMQSVFEFLRPFVAYSALSETIMRNVGRRTAGGVSEVGRGQSARAWVLVLGTGLGGGLLLLLSYSAVRVKFGHARKVSSLPPWRWMGENGLPSEGESAPAKAIVVRRSEKEMRQFLARLRKRYRVRVAVWRVDLGEWEWRLTDAIRPLDARTVYVVEDLRDAVGGEGAVALADELRNLRGVDVILGADVVPSYHIDSGAVGQDGNWSMWSNGWLELTREFEAWVWRGYTRDDTEGKGEKEREPWETAMDEELDAHPDLRGIVRTVKSMMENRVGTAPELRDIALRSFRAGALHRFKSIWAACSRDEQLQIVALARGGAPNFRQVAAISSLANRGIITESDPIELTSKAFGDFVNHDVALHSLNEWRRQGHRDWWRVTWLPLVILAGLALMFFWNSNPEAMGTLGAIGAALIAFIPVSASLLRVGQTTLPIGGSGATDQ